MPSVVGHQSSSVIGLQSPADEVELLVLEGVRLPAHLAPLRILLCPPASVHLLERGDAVHSGGTQVALTIALPVALTMAVDSYR